MMLQTPYRMLAIMLRRLYGSINTIYFELSWVPLMEPVLKKGAILIGHLFCQEI